jgi:hypothetical protein
MVRHMRLQLGSPFTAGRVQPPGEGPRLLHTHPGQSPPETADGAHPYGRVQPLGGG